MFKIVQSEADFPKFSSGDKIVVDVETSGFVPALGARICGIGLGCLKDDDRFYIPVRHYIEEENSGGLWSFRSS